MIENYLYVNCEKIQNSKDVGLLEFDAIRKWGEEVGPTILKKKKNNNSMKAEQKTKRVEEEEKHYKELFLNHSTFKGTDFLNLDYGALRKINTRILISDLDAELQANARLFLFEQHLVIEYEI